MLAPKVNALNGGAIPISQQPISPPKQRRVDVIERRNRRRQFTGSPMADLRAETPAEEPVDRVRIVEWARFHTPLLPPSRSDSYAPGGASS
jgi:hypothetical protein